MTDESFPYTLRLPFWRKVGYVLTGAAAVRAGDVLEHRITGEAKLVVWVCDDRLTCSDGTTGRWRLR